MGAGSAGAAWGASTATSLERGPDSVEPIGFPEGNASEESARAMVTVLRRVVVRGKLPGVGVICGAASDRTSVTGCASAPPDEEGAVVGVEGVAAGDGASARAMRGPMRRPAMASITAPMVSAPTRTRDGSGEVLRFELRIISIRSFS